MRSNPGFHSVQIGEMTVTALNDGQFEASTELVIGLDPAAGEAMLHETFRAVPPRITVSCLLLEWPGHCAIVDFGAGPAFGQLLGHAASRLAALGVAPGAVDTVLLTHGHIDHVGGLLTAGAPTFANATLHAHGKEVAFWNDPANAARNAEVTQSVLAAYAPRTETFTDGQAVLPGVTVVHLPGHTPGHSGFMISSGTSALLIWADIVHMPGLQFANPQAGIGFDTDVEGARASRLRALEMAASDRLMVAGMHHDFPLFGHVSRHGAGFAFEPYVWAPTSAGLVA